MSLQREPDEISLLRLCGERMRHPGDQLMQLRYLDPVLLIGNIWTILKRKRDLSF